MCGIAGYFGPRNLSDKIISKTLSLMKNRGPDSKGFYKLNFRNKSLYLFHSRLKIIDLSKERLVLGALPKRISKERLIG